MRPLEHHGCYGVRPGAARNHCATVELRVFHAKGREDVLVDERLLGLAGELLNKVINPSDVLREANSGPAQPCHEHEGEPMPVDARLHGPPLYAVGIRDPLEHHHDFERPPLGSAAFVRDGERLSIGGHLVPSGHEHLTVDL